MIILYIVRLITKAHKKEAAFLSKTLLLFYALQPKRLGT
jgi:hypothetical protein